MHAKKIQDEAMMHSDSLIERARSGDRIAQGKLVQLWYKRIYNYCYKFFLDHDLAMEASQKTFISMCRNIEALQDVMRFKSWLYKIAVNCCREEARRTKGTRAVSLDQVINLDSEESPHWEKTVRKQEDPEKQFQQQELSDMLQQCLMELSNEQREVVIMKEFEGLKFREIAEALNLSENTVKSRMYYGLDALKRILEKRNITKETISYEL
jgi:RNA polymerase sigma-70 factor (ECF subfamily)